MGWFKNQNKDKRRIKKNINSNFISAHVTQIIKMTDESVAVSLKPLNDQLDTTFEAGQYLNFKFFIEGEVVIRSYSIASSPNQKEWTVGVKLLKDGLVSYYMNKILKVGDHVEVSLPQGNFKLQNASPSNYSVAIVAGSGITPVLSMLHAAKDRQHGFKLLFGNKSQSSIMFKDTISGLMESSNLSVTNFLSQGGSSSSSSSSDIEGRIEGDNLKNYIKTNLDILKADGFYLCGPEAMIIEVSLILKEFGVNENKIHFELFTAPVLLKSEALKSSPSEVVGNAKVTAVLDGELIDFELNASETLLNKLLDLGYDAPYSCKGAVCCTCRAKVIEGNVNMDANFALSDGEIEEGYVLTCQSRAASEFVKIDYDV